MLRLERCPAAIAALLLLLEAAVPTFGTASAQDPDTVSVQGIQAADSSQAADSTQTADTASVDSAVVSSFPIFPDPAERPPGLAWEWEMSDLLSTGALTVDQLLEFTPLLNQVQAGFLGGPAALIFEGRGAGSFRYNEDGYEIAPILGGSLDARTIPLVQQQGLRLVREPGGYRMYTRFYRNEASEPYSRIEAGTGDQRSNLLRGFLSSRISKAVVGFGFDQVDTSGRAEVAGSARRTTIWATLAYPLPLGVWGQLEYRGSTAELDTFPDPKRTDWVLRLRRPFAKGWYGDLVAGTATLKFEPLFEDQVPEDSLEFYTESRTARQASVRAARSGEIWQAYLSVRFWDGEYVPQVEPEATFDLNAGPLAFHASGRFGKWEDFNSGAAFASLVLDLPLGLRFLADAEEGDRGLFGREPRRRLGFTRWTAGGDLALWGWTVGGRAGRSRAAPSVAIGEPIDTIVSLPGGTVDIYEVWATGPLFQAFGGQVTVGGRYNVRGDGAFLYWPLDEWRVDGNYRLRGLQDQLDIILTGMGGVRGPMWVTARDGEQGAIVSTGDLYWWRVEAVVRIKDFHIFYNYRYYDAPTLRGDLPGLTFPPSRYHFGVKWEFWN